MSGILSTSTNRLWAVFSWYNRFMNLKLTAICIWLAIAGAVLFPCLNVSAENTLSSPEVFISSDKLLQADTLLIMVKNETNEITGTFGSIKLRFFRDKSDKNWVAIIGATIDKKPGEYKLSINVPGKTVFEKDIFVSKRYFSVTSLVVTRQLIQKGFTLKNIFTAPDKKSKKLEGILKIITSVSYVNKPFVYPLFEVKDVGSFGNIRKSKDYTAQHLGVDLNALPDTPVFAVNDGKVVFVDNIKNNGNTVAIDHGLGVYSLYLHLNKFNVAEGQTVKLGDIVGLSGNTGYSLAPHLHFSIKVRGASLDPLKFVQTTQKIQ